MIAVLQKINCLKMTGSLSYLLKNSMDNLTELHISWSEQYSTAIKVKNMTFPNLKKLYCDFTFDVDFILISNLIFPKLEYVRLEIFERYLIVEDYLDVLYAFYNQVKTVTTYECYQIPPKVFIFKNLINLTFNLGYYNIESNYIDDLIKHKTLRKIKMIMTIYSESDCNILDKISSLVQAKTSVQLNVYINKSFNTDYLEIISKFEKKLEEIKRLTKNKFEFTIK